MLGVLLLLVVHFHLDLSGRDLPLDLDAAGWRFQFEDGLLLFARDARQGGEEKREAHGWTQRIGFHNPTESAAATGSAR